MAELVYAHGLGPCGATHESSSLSVCTRLIALTPIYKHEQEGMEIPIAFAEEKTKAGIKACLLAESRVKELQNSTKIQIFLIAPSGKQMNNTTLKQLHNDAERYNICMI